MSTKDSNAAEIEAVCIMLQSLRHCVERAGIDPSNYGMALAREIVVMTKAQPGIHSTKGLEALVEYMRESLKMELEKERKQIENIEDEADIFVIKTIRDAVKKQ